MNLLYSFYAIQVLIGTEALYIRMCCKPYNNS